MILNYSSSLSRDMSLNLTSSQSENALKQLKTLTSPLSKFATGMKSFGMNLDPRKMGAKVWITFGHTKMMIKPSLSLLVTTHRGRYDAAPQ